MAKLSPRLPGGDRNGLELIASAAVEHPHRQHVAVVILDTKEVRTDADTGDAVATLRIRRLEIVNRDDLPTAERLVRRALERRSGETVLPIELEDEITIAFRGIDPDSGELLHDKAPARSPAEADGTEAAATSNIVSLAPSEDRELYLLAVGMVVSSQHASVTMLQRKLRIGFAAAGRLLEEMQRAGIIGPLRTGSSTPPDVLVPASEVDQLLADLRSQDTVADATDTDPEADR